MRIYRGALAAMLAAVLAACSPGTSAITVPGCTPSPATICGVVTAIPVSEEAPHGFVYNPSGPLEGLWFTNRTGDATSGVVSVSLPSGATQLFPTPTAGSMPGSINIAPDKTLWFTETAADKVAKFDASHHITEYSIPTPNAGPLDITRGPDGAMWFTESRAGKIGRVAANGKITEFTIGTRAARPTSVITGGDGALWFTAVGLNKIGHLTTAGAVRYFNGGSLPMTGGCTTGFDGSFWFDETSKVARITASGVLSEFALPSGTFTTGATFGRKSGGVFTGTLNRNGTGSLVAIDDTGATVEYDLPQQHLLPIELALSPEGPFYMTVRSYKKGVSESTIFELR